MDQDPLPGIDEIFRDFPYAPFFLSLDLLMGNRQIHGSVEDRPKTEVITPNGLVVFKYMPFGLCYAPSMFERLLHRIFREHIGKEVAAYLDDVLMYAFQFPQLQPVFDRSVTTHRSGIEMETPQKPTLSRDHSLFATRRWQGENRSG